MAGSYRVIWKRSATEIHIARIIGDLLERGERSDAVRQAVDVIDRLLAVSPDTVGESRPAFERIMTVSPITVWYAVHPDEGIVYVLRADYTPPRHHRS